MFLASRAPTYTARLVETGFLTNLMMKRIAKQAMTCLFSRLAPFHSLFLLQSKEIPINFCAFVLSAPTNVNT